MGIYNENIIKFIDNELGENEKMKFMNQVEINNDLAKEFRMHIELNSYMKARFFQEQIENDVYMTEADILAKEVIADYIVNDSHNEEIKEFIRRNTISGEYRDFEIESIEGEIVECGIDKIVSKWINEEKKQRYKGKYDQEILDFINSALKEDNTVQVTKEEFKPTEFKIEKRKGIKKLYYYASAAAAVLIIVFVLWGNIFSGVSNEELFSENYTPLELINNTIVRGEAQKVNESLLTAAAFYKSNEFGKASVKFAELLNNGEKSAEIYLFYGICKIEEGNCKEAIKNFDYVIDNYDFYKVEAEWYKGLCYLRAGKIRKAINQFQKISGIKCNFQDKSNTILEELYKVK